MQRKFDHFINVIERKDVGYTIHKHNVIYSYSYVKITSFLEIFL